MSGSSTCSMPTPTWAAAPAARAGLGSRGWAARAWACSPPARRTGRCQLARNPAESCTLQGCTISAEYNSTDDLGATLLMIWVQLY